MNAIQQKKQIKAVGLISGGLDSILAAKIIKDLGIEVHGVHFFMPWNYNKKSLAMEAARQIGITFIALQLGDHYLEMLQNPKYGYGSAINPCIDCHAFMLKRAAEYMRQIKADFIFTGEVLGQRPMSQKRKSIEKVERESGLEGKLLRPLSAHNLEPTVPEEEGLVDRSQLLNIVGRSRKTQIQLAEKYNITKYKQPAGGCLLTDKNFAKRLNDFFKHDYNDFKDTIVLQWGRHFRIKNHFKAIIGRDEKENNLLERYARDDDHLMLFADEDKPGPILLLQGKNPPDEVLSIAAGLIQRFSRYKNNEPMKINCWLVNNPNDIKPTVARKLDPSEIQQMYL